MTVFCMMVGIPGSGKTYAAEHKIHRAVIHSSDAIRAELFGDASDQSNHDLVFQTLHKRVLEDLNAGRNVVYDATNLSYKRRMNFLSRLKGMDVYKLCLFLVTPYEKCLAQNAAREKPVPNAVIRRMYENADIPMFAEGWDSIMVLGFEDKADQLDDLIRQLSAIEHDNPHHQFTIGQHSKATQVYMETHYPQAGAALRRAALLHDIGKPFVKTFHDYRGKDTDAAHYYHHERVGAYQSFSYTGDLTDEDRLLVALLVRWHMAPFVVEHSQNPDKTRSKFRRLLGDEIWEQLMILNDCDRRAH